jgi:hypothetical protein
VPVWRGGGGAAGRAEEQGQSAAAAAAAAASAAAQLQSQRARSPRRRRRRRLTVENELLQLMTGTGRTAQRQAAMQALASLADEGGGEPNSCLNDAPCPPVSSHGASIVRPAGGGPGGAASPSSSAQQARELQEQLERLGLANGTTVSDAYVKTATHGLASAEMRRLLERGAAAAAQLHTISPRLQQLATPRPPSAGTRVPLHILGACVRS